MEEALTIEIDVHQDISQLSVESNLSNSQNLSPSSSATTTQEVTQEENPSSSLKEESTTVTLTVSTKPPPNFRFGNEKLSLRCYWLGCNYETIYLNAFTNHVEQHILAPALKMVPCGDSLQATLTCQWGNCQHQSRLSEDFRRHMFIHAFHCKTKSLGQNTIDRHNEPLVCRAKPEHGVPEMLLNFRCGWDTCKMKYVNCLEYYDHIRYHCLDNPTGKNVPGGIKCRWSGCKKIYPNVTKLTNHMRAHTREKLTACPTCGLMFSSRRRLVEHFKRQSDEKEKTFTCDVCGKGFATPGILRDHKRSHFNKFQCPECPMTTVSRSALASHAKYRHSDVTKFGCPHELCTYAAKTYCDLKRHLNAHETTTYHCPVEGCEFLAKTVETLKKHNLRKHAVGIDSNRYHCHLCDRKYTRGHSLTRHLKQAHEAQWPNGFVRFKYKLQVENGSYRLDSIRYEEVVISVES